MVVASIASVVLPGDAVVDANGRHVLGHEPLLAISLDQTALQTPAIANRDWLPHWCSYE